MTHTKKKRLLLVALAIIVALVVAVPGLSGFAQGSAALGASGVESTTETPDSGYTLGESQGFAVNFNNAYQDNIVLEVTNKADNTTVNSGDRLPAGTELEISTRLSDEVLDLVEETTEGNQDDYDEMLTTMVNMYKVQVGTQDFNPNGENPYSFTVTLSEDINITVVNGLGVSPRAPGDQTFYTQVNVSTGSPGSSLTGGGSAGWFTVNPIYQTIADQTGTVYGKDNETSYRIYSGGFDTSGTVMTSTGSYPNVEFPSSITNPITLSNTFNNVRTNSGSTTVISGNGAIIPVGTFGSTTTPISGNVIYSGPVTIPASVAYSGTVTIQGDVQLAAGVTLTGNSGVVIQDGAKVSGFGSGATLSGGSGGVTVDSNATISVAGIVNWGGSNLNLTNNQTINAGTTTGITGSSTINGVANVTIGNSGVSGGKLGSNVTVNNTGTTTINGSGVVAGTVNSSGNVTMNNGTISGTVTTTNNMNINAGTVSGTVQADSGTMNVANGVNTGSGKFLGKDINFNSSNGANNISILPGSGGSLAFGTNAGGTFFSIYLGGNNYSYNGATNTVPATPNVVNNFHWGSDRTNTGGGTFTFAGGNVANIHVGGTGTSTTGTVTLSITASSIGNVFLGGRGNSSVDIATYNADGENVTGSIYGGSNGGIGNVNQANITVSAGTVSGSVYGGGNAGGTVATANITVSGGTVSGSVYGGSSSNGTVTNANITVTADVLPNASSSIYGGPAGNGIVGTSDVEVTPGTIINNPVYGGGTNGTTNTSKVTIDGTVQNDVFGGGNTINGTTGTSNVFINGTVTNSVYGGGNDGKTTTSNVTIDGAVQGDVFGGGNKTATGTAGAGTTVTSHVLIDTGTVNGSVYGGGNDGASTTDTNVTIGSSATAAPTIAQYVFGGGKNSNVTNDTNVIYNGGTISGGALYGGCDTSGTVGGTANVTINNTLNNVTVFGGGNDGTTTNKTNVVIVGTTDENVYGGGEKGSANTTKVTITGTVTNSGKELAVYGGTYEGVAGNTEVIVGTTGSVTGNVYGGSHANSGSASVTGSTKVTIAGVVDLHGATTATPTATSGNVYGGSDAPVALNTTVDIESGADVQFVFGGGTTGSVGGIATVNLNGGTVNAQVYGGGTGANVVTTQVNVNGTAVLGDGTIIGNVYGGGHDATVGTANVTVTAGVVSGNIYGGGNGGATTDTNVLVNSNTAIFDSAAQTGSDQLHVIYGGGSNIDYDNSARATGDSPVTNTKVTIQQAPASSGGIEFVFGGGEGSVVTGTTIVNMTGGSVNNDIFGGGRANAKGSPTAANVGVTSTVTVSGGTVGAAPNTIAGGSTYAGTGSVYGGGNALAGENATVPSTTVTISGGTIATDVYGGGLATSAGSESADVSGATNVLVTGGTVTNNVYGGGRNSSAAFTTVSIKDAGIVENVFGGATGERVTTEISGNTNVIVDNGATVNNSVFGGGEGRPVAGSTTVEIGQNSTTLNIISGEVFGGGTSTLSHPKNGHPQINTTTVDEAIVSDAATVGGGTTVKVDNATIGGGAGTYSGNVYGGGRYLSTTTGSTSDVTGNTVVVFGANATTVGTTDQTGNVRGGGMNGSEVSGDTDVTIKGHVGHDVYGGGINYDPSIYAGSFVGGSTKVTLNGTADVIHNVYGGGLNESDVNTNTVVTTDVGSTVHNNVYGGGWLNSDILTGNTTVTISGTVVNNVYGGGDDLSNLVLGNVTVTVTGTGLVQNDVFGGGIKNSDISAGKASTYILGTVDHNVHGGGDDNSIVFLDTYVAVQVGGLVHNNVYGGGNNLSDINTGMTAGSTGTIVDIKGTVDNNVYGGGSDHSNVLQDAHVNVLVTGTTYGTVHKDVFGGGSDNSHILGTTGTTVTINGQVDQDVLGGGIANSNVAADTHVIVEGVNAGLAYVNGDVFGGGSDASQVQGAIGTTVEIRNSARIGATNADGSPNYNTGELMNPSYMSYPTYQQDKENDYYYGNVYGGGRNLSDITVGQRAKVTISPQAGVSGIVFGGGDNSSNVTNNTEVTIYGTVAGVYGGGRASNVGVDTNVLVDGTSALVMYDVYGGGYSDISAVRYTPDDAAFAVTPSPRVDGQGAVGGNTTVNISNGANVRERVFGAGHNSRTALSGTSFNTGADVAGTTSVNIAATAWIGHKDVLQSADFIEKLIGQNGMNVIERQEGDAAYDSVALPAYPWQWRYSDFPAYKAANNTTYDHGYNDGSWNTLGAVYGGGNGAVAQLGTSVVIDSDNTGDSTTRQQAFDRISGGSIGVESPGPRNVVINNLGKGDYTTDNAYKDSTVCGLQNFGIIRYLTDYTTSTANNSYLTVYYNLMGFDDGGLKLPYGTAYASTYSSEFHVDGGIYHPWRPLGDKSVVVEPKVIMDNYSKLRVRDGYSIEFVNGFDFNNPLNNKTRLLIDLPGRKVATTTRILSGVPDSINISNKFDYSELPSTLVPTNITDTGNPTVWGVNFYVPPMDVDSSEGLNSNQGGTNQNDITAGSGNGGYTLNGYSGGRGGSSGGGGGSGSASGGSAVGSAGVASAASTATGYITVDTKEFDTATATTAVQNAIKAAGANTTFSVVEKVAGKVSGDTLRAMNALAVQSGKSMLYYADTVTTKNAIEGRMYINPAKAANLTTTIQTGVYTSATKTNSIQNIFAKYFTNKTVVIHLAQKGSFGMEVEIAAKVNLTGLDQKNLMFYSYDSATNTYVVISNPRYYVDQSGFLHFTTSVGGDIIITDQPLQLR